MEVSHNILCVSAVCTVSATKAVRCLWLVNWNSYEPAQPITEADSLGRRQSVYISTHIAQTTNVVRSECPSGVVSETQAQSVSGGPKSLSSSPCYLVKCTRFLTPQFQNSIESILLLLVISTGEKWSNKHLQIYKSSIFGAAYNYHCVCTSKILTFQLTSSCSKFNLKADI